ncbi:hypothetical protein [Marinibactrum halimedae]|uniref:GTPase n=1 Tax=Marinibactrum halimedae TaxID=1444977 RepID=A0AA37T581_9GAMM|nr:hypothetical protein [Marinibactrum halimedae]MCD9460255.1 hypothetical protein [Marinibactrum halimedae]GLS24341.1 hypothetical protein GCM10007877_00520 [Marinibactrum halimedae]
MLDKFRNKLGHQASNLDASTNNPLQRLQLPECNTAKLSFCAGNKLSKVEQWAKHLPATQAQRIGALFYQTLPELSRVIMPAQTRLEILEYLRPLVQNSIHTLTRALIQHPLSLTEAELKSVIISQALQKHLSMAYSRAALDLSLERKPNASALNLCLHRALNGYGLLLLRNYQLYSPVPDDIWLHIHTLYLASHLWELDSNTIKDPISKTASSCQTLYIRSISLACASPYQLRLTEMNVLFEALEHWAALIHTPPFDQKSPCLFSTDTHSDRGPDYTANFSHKRLLETGLSINFDDLLGAFSKQEQFGQGDIIHIPHGFSKSLRDHLRSHWGHKQQRQANRALDSQTFEVCVGLTHIHNQLIKGKKFDSFLYGESNIMQNPHFETNWEAHSPDSNDDKKLHNIYTVKSNNSSANGYCITWHDKVPHHLRSGELMAIREVGKRMWRIGVIRWIKHRVNASLDLGFELLGNTIEAYGASTVSPHGGETDFMRAIMITEPTPGARPSFLTATMPFQEQSTITLRARGDTQQLQLGHTLFSTGSFSQFHVKKLN